MSNLFNGPRLLDYIEALKYKVLPLQLVVLRDADSDTWKPTKLGLDQWGDALVLLKEDGSIVFSVRGTSKAGAYYSKNPMNPKGCARLAYGQHLESWTRGLHHSQQAFVQCKPLLIHRDSNRDLSWLEAPQYDNGSSAINIHTTGNSSGSAAPELVGRWSAGCIVTRSPKVHYGWLLPEFSGSKLKYLTVDILDSQAYANWRARWS